MKTDTIPYHTIPYHTIPYHTIDIAISIAWAYVTASGKGPTVKIVKNAAQSESRLFAPMTYGQLLHAHGSFIRSREDPPRTQKPFDQEK